MKTASIVVFACLALFPFCVSAQNIPFVQYNANEGLISSNVYRCLEDSKGFMWFCTDNGVTRYDGFYFDQFTTDDGLSDSEVLGMGEDSQGRIWFLTFSGHLSYFWGNRIYNEQSDSTLKMCFVASPVQSMFEDKNGDLWFSSYDNSLIRKSPSGVKIFKFKFDLNHTRKSTFSNGNLMALPILNPNDNSLWVVFGNRLYELNKSTDEFDERELIDPIYRSLFGYKDQYKIQYMSENGLIWNCTVSEQSEQGMNFRTSVPNCFFEINDSLAIRSVDRTTQLVNTSNGKAITSLFDNVIVNYAYMDSHQNLWFCSNGSGIIKVSQFARNVRFLEDDGMKTEKSMSVFANASGIWTGLNNGVISLYANGEYRYQRLSSTDVRILSIESYRGNSVLVGTDKGAFVVFPDLHFERLNFKNVVQNSYDLAIKDIAVSPSGEVMMAISTGLTKSYELNSEVPLMERLCEGVINRTFCLNYADDSTIWYSSIDGLTYSKSDEICSGKKVFLCKDRIVDIDHITSDYIIATTEGLGLFVVKNKEIHDTIQLRSNDGKVSINRVCIANGNIWAATNKGVFKLVESNGAWNLLARFGINEGLPNIEVNDITYKDGFIYAATTQGVAILPESSMVSKSFGPVYIRKISGSWGVSPDNGYIELDYMHNNLVIDYSIVDIEQNRLLEFYYSIDDGDKKTSLKSRTLALSELPYGLHKIQIHAGVSGEFIAEPCIVMVQVNAPFWMRTWFRLILALVIMGFLALLIFVIVQRKIHRLQRTNAVNEERARISADLHDDIGADITRISLMAELSAKIKDIPDNDYQRQVVEEAKKLRSKTDQIVWALTPENDTLFNLSMYINHYSSEFLANSGVQLQFESNLTRDMNVSALKRRNVFLVVKEVLNNVLKHSRANSVFMKLEEQSGLLILSVIDNGIGFDHANTEKFFRSGLKNVRTRIGEIGGTVQWDSVETGGTRVLLKIPL